MVSPTFTLRTVDWPKVREAFIQRPERATYAELAAEFNLSEDRVKRAASDEGWSALRAAQLESRLKESDAATAILRAVKADATVIHGFSDLAVDTMAQLKDILDNLDKKKSVTTRANTLNTVAFAMSNLANALQKVGIVGLPKTLKDAADPGNGSWNPKMLQSLNITVQNLLAKPAARASTPTVGSVSDQPALSAAD